MTVKIRQYRQGGSFEVDIRFTYPDDTVFRRRFKAPVESKSAARRWGEERERELFARPSPATALRQESERKEVPTLNDFGPRFVENHARANRQKASGIASKETILKVHLYPHLGGKRLDAITDEDVQGLKAALAKKSTKTVNNVLTVLSKLLKVAVKWKVIKTSPCTIELLKVAPPKPDFYEFGDYRALVEAAAKIDPRNHLIVLLGGDAGLRASEMMALRWSDVDFRRRQLVIEQASWKGIVDTPKSGRGRIVPMTDALFTALQVHRHLRGEHVLYRDPRRPAPGEEVERRPTPEPVTSRILACWMGAAQRRAGVHSVGALHVLRHTFCSHLAMRGAPAKAIQELAGHKDLTTTLRYMHLSPSAREGAIKLLNRREEKPDFGEILEKASG